MDLKSFFESITSSAKATSIISLGSASVFAFLVLGSDNVLESLGLLEFRDDRRTILGLAFIFSTVALCIHVLVFVSGRVSRTVNRQLVIRGRRKGLHKLTDPEKAILRGFIHGKTKTQTLAYDSGVVQGLNNASTIYRATSTGHLDSWDFNIHDWAWDYLIDHPEILGTDKTPRGRRRAE